MLAGLVAGIVAIGAGTVLSIVLLGVSNREMPEKPFGEAETPEQSTCRRQAFEPVSSLVGRVVEQRRFADGERCCGSFDRAGRLARRL